MKNGLWAGAGSPCDFWARAGIWPWSLENGPGRGGGRAPGDCPGLGLGQGQGGGQGCPWRPRRHGNRLQAEPLYLARYIEHIGTGSGGMIGLGCEAGLAEPKFSESDCSMTTLWRKSLPTRPWT